MSVTGAVAVTTEPAVPLSADLRERTARAHRAAESSSFVADLLGGALPLSAYTALVAQNHAIYRALESVTPGWRDDPVAGPFVLDVLLRLPALEADLAVLLGPDWPAAAAALVQPATVRYVDHLHAVAGGWAAGFVAHHYVRYLGDLSGGQVVGRRMQDLFATAATAFYRFDAVGRIKPFRDDYRGRLDAVPVDPDERERLLAEAVVAFELNHAVFRDLAALAAS